MNIWLLQTGEPHPFQEVERKMRTGILADHLHARGHSIVWWSTNFSHQKKAPLFPNYKEVTVDSNYVIKLIKGFPYTRNVDLRRYLHHKLIAKRFKELSKSEVVPDVIVASTPDYDLAYEAVCFSKAHHVSALVDIRDLWPDIFADQIPIMFRSIAEWFLKHDFKKLEMLLRNADGLVAVSKRYLQWALDKAGRLPNQWDRVFFLGYKDSAKSVEDGGFESLDSLKERENRKLIVFIGTFGVSYELRLILEVARRMEEAGRTDVCFVLAGTGEQAESIKKVAAGLPNVVLPGWIDEGGISYVLQKGYLGLLPYASGAPQSIPNKPFEYLSTGLPLISSLEGEMAELIEKYRFGLNYRAGHLSDLCHCIEKLLDNPDLYEEMSGNALKFFREYGDADKIYMEYAEHIERLVEAQRINKKSFYAQRSF